VLVQPENGVRVFFVNEYSANCGGSSCAAERNGDRPEEAADGNCNWFQE
jgi:hypothetical protein